MNISKLNTLFAALISIGLTLNTAHAACEDISGIKLQLVKVTQDDRCYFASPSAGGGRGSSPVTDGQLTNDDCQKIIPPDPQFYGVFFIENNNTLGLSNMCEIAKKNH